MSYGAGVPDKGDGALFSGWRGILYAKFAIQGIPLWLRHIFGSEEQLRSYRVVGRM